MGPVEQPRQRYYCCSVRGGREWSRLCWCSGNMYLSGCEGAMQFCSHYTEHLANQRVVKPPPLHCCTCNYAINEPLWHHSGCRQQREQVLQMFNENGPLQHPLRVLPVPPIILSRRYKPPQHLRTMICERSGRKSWMISLPRAAQTLPTSSSKVFVTAGTSAAFGMAQVAVAAEVLVLAAAWMVPRKATTLGLTMI